MVLLLDTDFLTLLNESFYFQSVEFTFTGTKYETFSNWQIISVLKYGWMVTVFVSMGPGWDPVVPDVLSNTEADS